jgi:hypothetical protein
MKLRFDNTGKFSEATLMLVFPRDWTAHGVTKLSLWLVGAPGSDPDRVFVAVNGNPVYHDDPAATQTPIWQEWVIDLAAFGTDLTNVNTITIGVGTKGVPGTAGSGAVYIDDIRLIQ